MVSTHKVVAVALALSAFAILVSPFAASELTTVRAPQKLSPPIVVALVASFGAGVAWFHAPGLATWRTEQQLVLGGSAIVDLTSARLC